MIITSLVISIIALFLSVFSILIGLTAIIWLNFFRPCSRIEKEFDHRIQPTTSTRPHIDQGNPPRIWEDWAEKKARALAAQMVQDIKNRDKIAEGVKPLA